MFYMDYDGAELGEWVAEPPTPDIDGMPFWVCGERYRGSGRLSRTWIAQSQESPDTPEECTGQYPVCSDNRAPWAHAMAHIAYPFNGMGGEVLAGPFGTREEAAEVEAACWEDE